MKNADLNRLEKQALDAIDVVKAFRRYQGPDFASAYETARAAGDTISRYIRLRSQLANAERLRLSALSRALRRAVRL